MKIFNVLGVLILAASAAGCSKSGEEAASAAAVGDAPKAVVEKEATDPRRSAVVRFYEHRTKGDYAAAFDMMSAGYRGFYKKQDWIAAMKEIDTAAGGFRRADTAAWSPTEAVRVEYANLSADERLFVSESSPDHFTGFVIPKQQAPTSGGQPEPEPARRGERITDPATSLTFEQIAGSIAKNRPADLINRMKFEERLGNRTPWHVLAGQRELTLLHVAALNGASDSVAELIGLGTPVDVIAEHKSTPLFLAACAGHLDTVKLLVNRGANVSYENDMGLKPKDCAKAQQKPDVAAWLESQADDTPPSPFLPLWRLDAKAIARHDELCATVSKAMRLSPTHPQTVAQMKTLIDGDFFTGADNCFVLEDGPPDAAHHQVNATIRGERGRGKVVGNLLVLAAAVGSTEIVGYAVERGFDPDGSMYSYTDMNGGRAIGPAILIATQNGHADVVRLLIDKGANVNAVDTGTMRGIMDYAEDAAIRRMLLDAASDNKG